MGKVLVTDTYLENAGDAIRSKLGVETTYLPSELATAINSIPSGTQLSSADAGKVVVEDDGDYVLAAQTSRSISQNGTYDTTTNDEVVVSVAGGGGSGGTSVYTNAQVPTGQQRITDVSGFTKLYSTSVPYGSHGSKVGSRLGVTSESTIDSSMTAWNASVASYYDSENQIGAYAGYSFGQELYITHVKIWLGKYQQQNKTLTVTVQYMDENGNWNDVSDLSISPSIDYPKNVFTVGIDASAYGVRWYHYKEPYKSSSNNITFFGMVVYGGSGELIDVYIPQTNGLIEPPSGYDCFGPLFLM